MWHLSAAVLNLITLTGEIAMGHWYTKEGASLYTIKGANGKVRDTTLRDAKKLHLVPSVSGIIGQLDKPQLTRWKLGQLMDAIKYMVYETGVHGHSEEVLERKLWEEYKKQTEKYSITGTAIHDALEQYFKTGVKAEKYEYIIEQVRDTIAILVHSYSNIKLIAEESFTNETGYGGKIDLIIKTDQGRIILDFKTKQGENLEGMVYDDYCTQLAAYAFNYENVMMCGNLLISATHDVKPHLHIWDNEAILKGMQKFKHLLEYWKLANNHDTSFRRE